MAGGGLNAGSLTEVAEALEAVRAVFAAVEAMSGLAADLLGDVPAHVPPLLVADIGDLLLVSWLERRAPNLNDALRLLTIVGRCPRRGGSRRPGAEMVHQAGRRCT